MEFDRPSFDTEPSPVSAAVKAAPLLLEAAEDMPTPFRPPLEEPGFAIRWRSIVADPDEQICIGLAMPEPTMGQRPLQRNAHITLVRRLEETIGHSASTEQYRFSENKITRPIAIRGESAFVHPMLKPIAWAQMINLLRDAQYTLKLLGKM